MIQDIQPKKLRNEYDPNVKVSDEDFVFIFNDLGVLNKINKAGNRIFPRYKEITKEEGFNNDAENYRYLFKIDDEKYFLYDEPFSELDISGGLLKEYAFTSVRDVRYDKDVSREEFFALSTAVHLNHWYTANRYCGHCGSHTVKDTKERALKCTNCGNIIYPKICPAVIVGVTNKDKILITKYARGFAHYALVAGFTEIGETLEETVQREVMEETGLLVKNIRYYKSQPWGVADDLLAGFYCDVCGDDNIKMDENELKLAEWYKREDIILQPDDYSLTNEMMQEFKEGRDH